MNTYTRAVRDCLRDEYAVEGLTFFNGGNHPRAEFVYRGKTVKLTLHRQPGGVELGASTIEMKLRDIRRALGAAPDRGQTKCPRKLADMLPQIKEETEMTQPALTVVSPEPETNFTTHAPARIAHYPFGSRGDPNMCRVAVFLTEEGFKTFGHATGVIVTYLGDGKFKIVPHTKNITPRFTRTETTDDRAEYRLTAEISATGLPAFGRTETSAALLPGSIEIKAPSDGDLKAPKRRRGVTPSVVSDEAKRQIAPSSDAAPNAAAPDQLRYLLSEIVLIEAATPYRLIKRKDTGAWVWKAPLISLDDEG